MKKIISMLCVVAMMFSFVAISANAATVAVSLVENAAKSTDDKLAYDVVVENTDGITGVVIQLDFSDFLTKNADMAKTDFTAEKVEATGANLVTNGTSAFIASNYTDTNGAKTEVTMFTVFIDKANFKNDATFTFRSACKITAMGSTANVFSSAVKNGATIAAPVVGGEDKGYEELDATVIAKTGWTVDGKETDWQAGTGFKAEFVVPAALDSMKWSAEINGVRKYSSKYDLTGFAGIEVGSRVVLYGAFTNGAWEGNAFDKTDATMTVNEENAGIILKSGETFYASANAIAE